MLERSSLFNIEDDCIHYRGCIRKLVDGKPYCTLVCEIHGKIDCKQCNRDKCGHYRRSLKQWLRVERWLRERGLKVKH